MIPKLDQRKMQQMMRKMGIAQQDMEATEVIIKLADKELVITDPQVTKVNMMGQVTYQVVGEAHERSKSSAVEISQDDIDTVVEQTGVSAEAAKAALEETGDLAEAILKLKS